MIATFVREFTEEWNRRLASRRRTHAALEAELGEVERRIAKILEAIEEGIFTATTKEHLLQLEASATS